MQGLADCHRCGYWVHGNLAYSCVARSATSAVSFPGCGKFSTLEKEGKFLASGAVVQSGIKDSSARAAVFLETGQLVPENPLLSTARRTLNTVEELAITEGTATVRAKFVLQKKCRFGERFDVVGSDPVFGNWDPKAGVPMEWSEGHSWSVEMDVPHGKKFEFKFVRMGVDGEIEWQPGSNHYLDTTESISPLVVSEPWSLEEAESDAEKAVAVAEQDTQINATEAAATAVFALGMDTLILEEDQLRRAEVVEPKSQADDSYGKLPLSHSSAAADVPEAAGTEFPLQVPSSATTLAEGPDGIADNSQLLT